MAKDIMQKVGELLKMAGLDEEVVKSVTEALADEEGNSEEEVKVEESEGCPEVKHEEEDDEDEKEAPVDKEINDGGYDAVKEDLEVLKREYAKLIAEQIVSEAQKECDEECEDKKKEDDEVEVEKEDEDDATEKEVDESEDELSEALYTLLEMVQEAQARSQAVMEDFEALKEEYAKLVAQQIIAESTDAEGAEEDEAEAKKHVEEEKDAEAQKAEEEADKDKAEGKDAEAEKHEEQAQKDKEEAQKDKEKEEKDYEEAHESDSTADEIAKDVTSISESVEVEKSTINTKAYSVFSSLNESAKVTKPARKAYTVFPNL